MNWFALLLVIFGVFLAITGINGTYGQVYLAITGQQLPFTVPTSGGGASFGPEQQTAPTPKHNVMGGHSSIS